MSQIAESPVKNPVSRQVVVCLARIANDLDTVKNCFHDPNDKQTLCAAVATLHRVAIAHDRAGGYGRYVADDEYVFEGSPHTEKIEEVREVDFDYPAILGQIKRTVEWLNKHHLKVKSMTWHFFGGSRVRVAYSHKLRMLFSEGRYSRGNTRTADKIIEHWEARDPVNNVIVEWDEERSC